MKRIDIDTGRLWHSLEEMATIGATLEGGVSRPALSVTDGKARNLLCRWCFDLGLDVRVDQIGNMFALRAGSDPRRPPIVMGSHLDSQPTGGRYDGTLGVLAALEILRAVELAGVITSAPILLVNWTNEEGWRFRPPMTGASVFAGSLALADALVLSDDDKVMIAEALSEIGYAGSETAGFGVDSLFELHIEQGPTLEDAGLSIGVVVGAAGKVRFDVRVQGRASHAATTPMHRRNDALAAAAEMVSLAESAGVSAEGRGVTTVGKFEIIPNSRNVVPAEALFSIDLRHEEETALLSMADALEKQFRSIAKRRSLTIDIGQREGYPPTNFDATCVQLVRDAATCCGYGHTDIVSGAGHDAVVLASAVPAAMIFVPCKAGISHAPDEAITPEWATAGAEVLASAVITRAM